MLVSDGPVAAALAEAGGVADCHVKRPAGDHGAAESLKTVAESHVLVCCDAQVAYLAVDRAIE